MFGTFYLVTQQTLRAGANDPQIQLAIDEANALNAGQTPDQTLGGRVDIDKSLAPFTIVYNAKGQPIAGSGYLGTSLPTVPFGTLSAADHQTYHAVTWQPQRGVRIAAVTVKANGYYVLTGRSLQLVEQREDMALWFTSAGLVATIALLVIWSCVSVRPYKSKTRE